MYCVFSDPRNIRTDVDTNKKPGIWEPNKLYTREIQGGRFYYSAPNSDCKADDVITKNTVSLQSFDLNNETKHSQVWSWTQRIMRILKKKNSNYDYYFTGHSLGGSLALNCFLNSVDESTNCYYRGFNAASLFLYNFRFRTINAYKEFMYHYRFNHDLTSRNYGKYIPTALFITSVVSPDFLVNSEKYHSLLLFKSKKFREEKFYNEDDEDQPISQAFSPYIP